jgi:hypothetical protein
VVNEIKNQFFAIHSFDEIGDISSVYSEGNLFAFDNCVNFRFSSTFVRFSGRDNDSVWLGFDLDEVIDIFG